jgi:hypothetical protein
MLGQVFSTASRHYQVLVWSEDGILCFVVLGAGLGVAKFIVQLGVFASVLYTLLALDIDPVEQLVKLLPISEVRQGSLHSAGAHRPLVLLA